MQEPGYHEPDSTHSPCKFDIVIFDLDGTISDPILGIARSANYALSSFGYETREIDEFAAFIGPPIDHTFRTLVGTDDEAHIADLVARYRERYGELGFAENTLYPGVAEALSGLHEAGVPMGVCTSKRRDFAVRILELFGLLGYFQVVDGGDVGIPKWRQLAALCEQGIATSNSIMIGDRAVDLVAAHKNGLHSGGVLWGYGNLPELHAEQPEYVFRSPAEVGCVLMGGQVSNP
jgi:phosphoglycolate phosphatase